MCPASGQAKWAPCNVEQLSSRVRKVCSHGVISILRAVDVRAGPRGGGDAQWAKSGTRPDNAACDGCIITEAFAEAVWSCLQSAPSSEYTALLTELETVLSSPQNYLDPKCLNFLHRYVAAGNIGAYAFYLPLRCATSKYYGALVKNLPGDATELILADKIQTYVLDGSWDDSRCEQLRSCLACWLRAGVPPSSENLYLDHVTKTEYSQFTLQDATEGACQRLELICSPSLHKYYLELHRLIVGAVGEQKLSSLPDRCLPGTVECHQAQSPR